MKAYVLLLLTGVCAINLKAGTTYQHILPINDSLPILVLIDGSELIPDWLNYSFTLHERKLSIINLKSYVQKSPYIYAITSNNFYIIDDVSFAVMANITTAASQNHIFYYSGFVYISSFTGVLLYDVTSPSLPVLVYNFATSENIVKSMIIEDVGYLVTSLGSLLTYNLSDYSDISTPISSCLQDIFIFDNDIIGGADSCYGLRIFNISNPKLLTSIISNEGILGNLISGNGEKIYYASGSDIVKYIFSEGILTYVDTVKSSCSISLSGIKYIDGMIIVTCQDSFLIYSEFDLRVIYQEVVMFGLLPESSNIPMLFANDELKIITLHSIIFNFHPGREERGVHIIASETYNNKDTFYVTVENNVPLPPGETYSARLHYDFNIALPSFIDPDDDTIIYEVMGLENWMNYSDILHRIFGLTPNVTMQGEIIIVATDTYNASSIFTFQYLVYNTSPILGPDYLASVTIVSGSSSNYTFGKDIFLDADGDNITYRFNLDGMAVPEWISFLPEIRQLTIYPPKRKDYVSHILGIIGTDTFGSSMIRYTTFNILSDNTNKLPIVLEMPQDYTIPINSDIYYKFNTSIFEDPDGDKLKIRASSVDGRALPYWINFNGDEMLFTGLSPGYVSSTTIVIGASDDFGIASEVVFYIHVIDDTNYPPILQTVISDVYAYVDRPLRFALPLNLYEDRNLDDQISLTSAHLPPWITFENGIFEGTPSPEDTGIFSDKITRITVYISDGIHIVTTDFSIIVQGESYYEKIFRALFYLSVFPTIAMWIYAKRSYLWKKFMKSKYRLPEKVIIIGQEDTLIHQLELVDAYEVSKFKLLMNGKSLPGGRERERWLIYKSCLGKFYIDWKFLSDAEDLEVALSALWTVRIRKRGYCIKDLVCEEFDIRFSLESEDSSVLNTPVVRSDIEM